MFTTLAFSYLIHPIYIYIAGPRYNVYINKILWIFIIIPVFKFVTWQVMQLSLLQIGHLKLLMLSLMKHHPSQSGVLQWNEFLEVAWASFTDFCWCFSNTAGDTNYQNNIKKIKNKGLKFQWSNWNFRILL